MIVLAMYTLNVLHPGRLLEADQSVLPAAVSVQQLDGQTLDDSIASAKEYQTSTVPV